MKNRILEDLSAWSPKEEQLKTLFGDQVSGHKQLLKGKLDYFEKIQKSHKAPFSTDEKLFRKVLNDETKRLRKLVYPNRIVRAVVGGYNLTVEVTKVLTNLVAKWRPQGNDWIAGNLPDFGSRQPGKDRNTNRKSSETFDKDMVVDKKSEKQNKSRPTKIDNDPLLPKLRQGNGKGLSR